MDCDGVIQHIKDRIGKNKSSPQGAKALSGVFVNGFSSGCGCALALLALLSDAMLLFAGGKSQYFRRVVAQCVTELGEQLKSADQLCRAIARGVQIAKIAPPAAPPIIEWMAQVAAVPVVVAAPPAEPKAQAVPARRQPPPLPK